LFSDEFLYTVIDGDRLDEFIKMGTYRKGNIIFALTKDELKFKTPLYDYSLDTALAQYVNPAIAVYKSAHLENQYPYAYSFINPDCKVDALEAIIEIVPFL